MSSAVERVVVFVRKGQAWYAAENPDGTPAEPVGPFEGDEEREGSRQLASAIDQAHEAATDAYPEATITERVGP